MAADPSDPPRARRDPLLPLKVGRYEVVQLVGEGAMGRVLLVHDPVLDRDVAVKYLRGDLQIPRDARDALVARMQNEARAAARVAHPNLVVLHDMGEDAEVGLYLVFEYVEGPTLKQRLLDERRLGALDAARLARELSSALTIAHEAGILHRDIKPENIMLSRTGGKIADFGIARIPDSTLTHQGGLMGTPAYSAPETFRTGKFSPASDQFSLAASLYEAISGFRAFPGEDAVTVAALIASESPEPFAATLGLPPAVDDVLARAMAREPGDRFPTCDAFGAALSHSLTLPTAGDLATSEVSLQSVTLPPAPSRPPERRLGQVLLGGLLVVVTAALVLRTALRSADPAEAPASSFAGVSAASPLPSASPARLPLLRVPTRGPRPRVELSPSGSVSPPSAASPSSTLAGPVVGAETGPGTPSYGGDPLPTSSAQAPDAGRSLVGTSASATAMPAKPSGR